MSDIKQCQFLNSIDAFIDTKHLDEIKLDLYNHFKGTIVHKDREMTSFFIIKSFIEFFSKKNITQHQYSIKDNCIEKFLELISGHIENKSYVIDSAQIIDLFNCILNISKEKSLIIPDDILSKILKLALNGVDRKDVCIMINEIIVNSRVLLEFAITNQLSIPSDFIKQILDIVSKKALHDTNRVYDRRDASCIITNFLEILKLAIDAKQEKKIIDIPDDFLVRILNIFFIKALDQNNDKAYLNFFDNFYNLTQFAVSHKLNISEEEEIVQKIFDCLLKQFENEKYNRRYTHKIDLLKRFTYCLEIAKKYNLTTPNDTLRQILNIRLPESEEIKNPLDPIETDFYNFRKEIQKKESFSNKDSARYLTEWFSLLQKNGLKDKDLEYFDLNKIFFVWKCIFLLNKTPEELFQEQINHLNEMIKTAYGQKTDYEVINIFDMMNEESYKTERYNMNNKLNKLKIFSNQFFDKEIISSDEDANSKFVWFIKNTTTKLEVAINYSDNNTIEIYANLENGIIDDQKFTNYTIKQEAYKLHLCSLGDPKFPETYEFSAIFNAFNVPMSQIENAVNKANSPENCLKLDIREEHNLGSFTLS